MHITEEIILGSFERKISAQLCLGGKLKILFKNELYKLYDDIELVKKIKFKRLCWLGHVRRVDGGENMKSYRSRSPSGWQMSTRKAVPPVG